MTVLAGRRRRTTLVASIAAIVAAALVATLTVIGALALYNSTDGVDASAGHSELVFPRTPVGAIAALDPSGALASLAVIVVQPSGAGGSVVPVPVSADSTGGSGEQRRPLDETLATDGQVAMQDELAALLRLGIGAVAFVDTAALADSLRPVGPLIVDLPADVSDAEGRVVAKKGRGTMDAAAAAAVLTARDENLSTVERYEVATAVWESVAKSVGTGATGAGPKPTPSTSTTAVPAAASSDVAGMFDALIAGRVGARSLRTTPASDTQGGPGADVVRLDPAEVLLVFGQIAPGAVSAPSSGLTFRVVSTFSAGQLAATGLTNSEIAYRAIMTILYIGGNVVSVSTSGGAPGASTSLAVSDASVTRAADRAASAFGSSAVEVDPLPIAGVDVVATLGTDFLKSVTSGGGPTTRSETTDG